MFTGKFYFEVYGSSIRNAMSHYVGFTVFPDVDDSPVLGEKLAYRVITSDTAVFTEGDDDLIL